MCGRGYNPRFLFTWPNARTSVMGGQQAAQVLVSVKQEQLAKQGRTLSAEEVHKQTESLLAQYEQESSAYYSTAHLWDDGILDPAETRKVLGFCLDVAFRPMRGETRLPIFRW